MQGRGLGTSIASSIKDKTIASIKGVTEGFDPLNIATAFGGSLGGYAFGKLTGRSKDDISYFTGRSGRGSFMDSRKNKNPLVTKVGSGENRPTKKGEGLADILARIFNLIKKQSQEVKKRQEITANFEEEKENEKQLRHKDLLEAISNMGGGTATLVGPVKQEKGMFAKLLAMMKNMIEKAMKSIKPILEFVQKIMKALGGKALTFLKFLAALGTDSVLSVLLPATAALGLLYLVKSEKDKILANPDADEYRNTPFAQRVRGEAASKKEAAATNIAAARLQVPRNEVEALLETNITDEELKQKFGADREQLKKWLDKTKGKEKTAKWQRPVLDSGGDIIVKAGDTTEDLRVKPKYLRTPTERGSFPGGSNEPSSYLVTPRAKGFQPGGSNEPSSYLVTPRAKGFNPGGTMPVENTGNNISPVSAMPSPVTGRMQMAQRQNFDLNLDDATSSEPIIINKNNVVSGPGDSGGTEIVHSAPVREQHATLKGIQKQNLRSFA
jgi:hypothetical protein